MLHHLTHFLGTLFLFTKSDLWTVMLPITAFSQFLVNAPSSSLSTTSYYQRLTGLVAAMLWTWLNLLQFATSNQTKGSSPEEDAKNKPYRPIPAKRISLYHAQVLRWALVPITLVVSLGLHLHQQQQQYQHQRLGLGFGDWKSSMWAISIRPDRGLGCVVPSIVITLLTIIHDEFGGHEHYILKGGTTGIAYAAFAWGATCLASHSATLTGNQHLAIIRSTLIILSTIHAQDFRDVEGDALLGRTTLPIAYPALSRASMPLILLCWSIFLAGSSIYMNTIIPLPIESDLKIGNSSGIALGLNLTRTLLLDVAVRTIARWATIMLGAWVGIRFYSMRDMKNDAKSYNLYNIWLSLVHIVLSQ